MYDDICISCFRRKGTDTACPHCGYVESGSRKHALLPARYVLQNRYLIGEAVSADKNGVCYKAMDMQKKKIVEVQEHFPRELVMRDTDTVNLIPMAEAGAAQMDKSVQILMQNAKTMMQFSECSGIMRVFDVVETNRTVYIINEYLEGMLLEDYLKQCGGKVDVETAIDILVPILDGLTQLHKADLVHRAVTPKNILISSDNTIKLINFVFLKEASPFKENEMTVYFSPGYAPYEQYVSKERRGAYTDIYSVGAVLYRLLLGKAPADAISRREEDPIRDELNAAGLPEYLVQTIRKAMEMNKDVRFKSAVEMKNALLQKTPVVDVNAYLEKSKQKKQVLLIAGLAAVLTVLLVVLGIVVFRLL